MEELRIDQGHGTVLIVDDNAVMLLSMSKILAAGGYEILTAKNGTDAIKIANEKNPHLILLDVMMPDMSGYEVCKELKKNPDTEEIPIVFISGLTSIPEQVDGLKLGALDYVTKPVDKNILLTKTRSFVQLSLVNRQNVIMRIRQQEANHELEQFSQALDNASDGVVFTDTEGCITFVNIAFGYMTQHGFADIESKSIEILFEEDIKGSLMEAIEGVAVTVDCNLLRKDGGSLPVQIRCSAIMNEVFQPTGLLVLIADLTEHKQAEEERERLELELFHSQKLESVGQLAAGIAHEINTPIQFVGDNIRFMQDIIQDLFELNEEQGKLLEAAKEKGVDESIIENVEKAAEIADLEYLQEEIPKAIEQSLDGVKRVSSIVLAMKEFAHPGTTEMSMSNINEAITTTITVARNKWKYVAELETEFDEALPMIPCLIGEMNQVILNLVVNAADAIQDQVGDNGGQGKITISTKTVDDFVEIRISDTGGGIPEEIQEKVFDPFFTTKEVGRGSGQGLAIARGVIVNKHHGEFDFETEVGIGTTFIVRLPLTQESTCSNNEEEE